MGKLILLPLMRILAWTIFRLPRRGQMALGRVVGSVFCRAGFRKKVIHQNLEVIFPGAENALKRRTLFKEAYRHFGKLVLEILYLLGPMSKLCTESGRVLGGENWRQAKAEGRGVIFLSDHVGNWEVMAALGTLRLGLDLMLVTKALKPDWLHQAIEQGRQRCGVMATYEPKTFRDVLRHLKNNGTVGIVLDQYAGAPVGVRVPFFGTAVGTQSMLAVLAKRTGAVVLPVINYRQPDGQFSVEIGSPISWQEDTSPQREIAINTLAYTQVIEAHILAHPEQWLWTHRRFKGDLSPIQAEEWEHGRARL